MTTSQNLRSPAIFVLNRIVAKPYTNFFHSFELFLLDEASGEKKITEKPFAGTDTIPVRQPCCA